MKQITISLSEYERLKDLIAQADTRHGLEMAALERRYQERIKQMQRDHHAEVTRLESAIAHQAEQADREGRRAALPYKKWVHLGGDEWCCSSCGNVIYTEGSWEKPEKKYCEECGAKMDVEQEE